eukprot:6663820-Prymnesium_polylepis.2
MCMFGVRPGCHFASGWGSAERVCARGAVSQVTTIDLRAMGLERQEVEFLCYILKTSQAGPSRSPCPSPIPSHNPLPYPDHNSILIPIHRPKLSSRQDALSLSPTPIPTLTAARRGPRQ